MGRIICSVSVTPELHQLARENFISITEATRVGIGIMLAEKGVQDYDSNLNLHRRMTKFRIMAEESLQKLAALEEEKKKLDLQEKNREILYGSQKEVETEKV